MRARPSLTVRLTLLFVAGSAAILTLLGSTIGGAIKRHFADEDRSVLLGKLELIRQLVERIEHPDELFRLPFQLEDALVGHHDLIARVVGPEGELILQTGPIAISVPDRQRISAHSATPIETWSQENLRLRGLQVNLLTKIPDTAPLSVSLAIDLIHHEAFLHSFNRSLWLSVMGAAFLSGLIGWLAARQGLKPLQEMRHQVDRITANQLSERLPVETVPAELANLASTLNDMLERLEDAFRRLTNFSSDIAHELRTPVSNLLTETQVALAIPRDAQSYRQTLESTAEECVRLSRTIADMLLLAKAENGLMLPNHGTVDLCQQMRELIEFYEPVIESKHLRVEQAGQCKLSGDALMLRRAFGNLLSNAVRYTPDGGSIAIQFVSEANDLVVRMTNSGPSISPDHLPHIFNRFYRADAARQHEGVDGSGLGLAITKAIIGAHRGTIGVESTDVGTIFTVRLPVSETPIEKTS